MRNLTTKKLSELLTIKNGSDYKHLNTGNIPLLGSGGIMGYVDDKLYDKKSILLPRKGTLGNIMFIESPFWTVDTLYWSEINEEEVSPYYLYLYLSLLDLSPISTGSTLPSMTMGAYYSLEIDLPDRKHQDKIADFIYKIDSLIKNNNLLIETINNHMKLLYNYWFIQFDFPDENGKPYKSSGGKMVWNEKLKREIPEGWKVQTLFKNEISEIVSGGVEPYDGTKEYLATADIDENGALEGELLNYDERPNRANMSPIKNSVWVAKMADSPKRLFFTDESNLLDQYIISTGMFAFTSNKEHYEYLMMYLFSDHFEKLKDRFAQGATQRAINQANLSLFPIVIPEENILKQFHNLTKDMVRKIELLKEENIELKKQRDFLLPLLMNGQVTIK